MSEAYGIGWNEFLPALGLKVPARPRSLNIRPPWLWLLALKGQTGVAAAFIRGHMTFEQLSAGMAWFVHRATPCPICAANKPPGGLRHVEWLGDLAPWTLMCDRHPCPILASEAGRCHRRETINRDVKALACRPQSTAFSDPPRPFPSVPLSAAACVDMVEAINTRLKLHLREGQHGHAVFAVHDILMARQVDEASRPWLRNSRAVSAWYAWHVHAYPDVVLHRHTRCRDHDQTCDPLTMLYDFRHTGVISAEWEGQTVAGIALPAQARSRRLADGYLVAADAPSTVRAYAYTADWTHFSLWFASREVVPMPASPVLVGDYLSDLGEGYARSTLRRKVAAIARAYRHAGHPLDTRNPSIRDALRGIGRTHGSPPKRAQALATEEVQRLVATCDDGLVGLRDRALLLVAFAGALRRSELCGIEVRHITWKPRSLELLIPRSKTDAKGEGARIGIPHGKVEATCPVRALQAWLDTAGVEHGPLVRAVTRHNTIRAAALSGEAVRLVVLNHARLAGIKGSRLEPVSPHRLRAGFVTSAYRAQVPAGEIMGNSRHRSLATLRSYVRRSKPSHASPAGRPERLGYDQVRPGKATPRLRPAQFRQ